MKVSTPTGVQEAARLVVVNGRAWLDLSGSADGVSIHGLAVLRDVLALNDESGAVGEGSGTVGDLLVGGDLRDGLLLLALMDAMETT